MLPPLFGELAADERAGGEPYHRAQDETTERIPSAPAFPDSQRRVCAKNADKSGSEDPPL